MTEFVLDVSKWRCGDESENPSVRLGEGPTQMLNEEGYMCCLGQFAKQILGKIPSGLCTPVALADLVGLYSSVFVKKGICGDNLVYFHTQISHVLMSINDSSKSHWKEKIKDLHSYLGDLGHTIKVINLPDGEET